MEAEARVQALEFGHAFLRETVWDLTRRFCNLEYFVCSHLGPVTVPPDSGFHPGSLPVNPTEHVTNGACFVPPSSFREREVPDVQELYSMLLKQLSKLEVDAQRLNDNDGDASATSSSSSISQQRGPPEINNYYTFQQPGSAFNPPMPHPYQLHHPPEEMRYNSDGVSIERESEKKKEKKANINASKTSVLVTDTASEPMSSSTDFKKRRHRDNNLPTETIQSGILPKLLDLSVDVGPQKNRGGNGKSQNNNVQPSNPSKITVLKPTVVTTKRASKDRKAKKPKKCQKLCSNKPGHPCGHIHNAQDKCPPCSHSFPNVELKCGHVITIACHLRNKVDENICKVCTPIKTAKQLKKNQNSSHPSNGASTLTMTNPAPSFSKPDTQFPAQTKFTFGTQLSDLESAQLKMREIIDSMDIRNVEQPAEDLVQLLSQHPNLISKAATNLFQRAVIDSEKQMPPLAYTKLITRIKNNNNSLDGFLDKLVELTMSLFSSLFSDSTNDSSKSTSSFNPGSSIFLTKTDTADTLSHKSHSILRFIGTLFKVDIVNVSDMKTFAGRLIARPDETHLDYLCKFLTFAGQKIHDDILALDTSTVTVETSEISSRIWLKGLYDELLSHSLRPDMPIAVQNDIQRVVLRQENRWKELDGSNSGTENVTVKK